MVVSVVITWVEDVLLSLTCQQKPLRFIDMNRKVGVLIIVPFVLLHWFCHSHIPQLDLHVNEENKVNARKVSIGFTC